ncbi:DUF6236 family protein [Glycomyces arizonensis]|uniref:DUF6236 family protein n=1 Tax=Glycomyces arizonensis TaxID=256035 RepID=UPI0034E0BA96
MQRRSAASRWSSFHSLPTIELERAVRHLGIDTALNATAVKVELAGAAIVSIGGPIATGNLVVGAAGAAGAAFAALSVRHEHAKQRSALVRNSPVEYLWKVDRMLRPRSLLQRVLMR